MVMMMPLLKQLKKDGYHITANVSDRGKIVLLNNPYIDEYDVHVTDSVPMDKLKEYWEEKGKGFDRVVNLSGSIEMNLLKLAGQDLYDAPHEERHAQLNRNYIDETMSWGGYPDIKGAKTELFFNKAEHHWAKNLRKKYRNKFWIMVSLAGSSYHKVYPYMEYVITEFLDNHKEAIAWTVGDSFCQILEWEHPRTKCLSRKLNIRKTMLLTQYVDLVIGTETGVLNAAACYNTPKIILLSHSSEENLTKYWTNTIVLHADAKCYPCHKLHHHLDSCTVDSKIGAPICMSGIGGVKVLESIEEMYRRRHEENSFSNRSLAYA